MWKTLKGYFIVEEEEKKTSASTLPPKKEAPSAGKSSEGPIQRKITPSVAEDRGTVNDRSVKVLMEAMERANLPGFDYLEYKKALQNLKKMNFTDEIRFQTAFATAQSMGVTPQKLSESAAHYLDVLGKEQEKFEQALAGQRARQVEAKEDRLRQLDASVEQLEAKIEELRARIQKTKAERKKLSDTIGLSSAKLAKTKADFQATLTVIANGIREDIASMKTYLK